MISVRNTPDVLPLDAPPTARYKPVICAQEREKRKQLKYRLCEEIDSQLGTMKAILLHTTVW